VFSDVGQSQNTFFRAFIQHGSLLGGQGANLMVDTGLDIDGALEPRLLREQARRPEYGPVRQMDKTRWYFSQCVWEGETYTNIVVRDVASVVAGKGANVVGLRFLARHLVTFDFPNRTLYLQRQSNGPPPDDSIVKADALMRGLVITDGKLPGDIDARLETVLKGQTQRFWFPGRKETLNVTPAGDGTSFHYTVVRKNRRSPWKLTKAWSTDRIGRTLATYPIP
jgi:hypothetical protein